VRSSFLRDDAPGDNANLNKRTRLFVMGTQKVQRQKGTC